MTKFILGTKINMTQIFDEAGIVHPVTAIKAGPMIVTQVKSEKTDGYSAIQVGFGARKAKNINKPLRGHIKDNNFMYLREFRTDDTQGNPVYTVGDAIDISTFSEGDKVTVSSISKGKGFQGVVKRHGFKGGPRSHGQKHSEREPGSIGGGGRAGGRVVKGMRMAGRMGGERVTVKNLKIIKILPETREIFIRGAIPGRRGSKVEILSIKS